jgi:hypothetical protein
MSFARTKGIAPSTLVIQMCLRKFVILLLAPVPLGIPREVPDGHFHSEIEGFRTVSLRVAYMYTYIHTYISTNINIHICVYIYICMYMYIYIYSYVCLICFQAPRAVGISACPHRSTAGRSEGTHRCQRGAVRALIQAPLRPVRVLIR